MLDFFEGIAEVLFYHTYTAEVLVYRQLGKFDYRVFDLLFGFFIIIGDKGHFLVEITQAFWPAGRNVRLEW